MTDTDTDTDRQTETDTEDEDDGAYGDMDGMWFVAATDQIWPPPSHELKIETNSSEDEHDDDEDVGDEVVGDDQDDDDVSIGCTDDDGGEDMKVKLN